MTVIGNQSDLELQPRSQKVAIVFGGGGFIGHHLAKRLMREGYWVRIVDLHAPQFCGISGVCDDLILGDLRSHYTVGQALDDIPLEADIEVYQLAADMGGAGFVFTGENDSDILHNSAQINLNVVDALASLRIRRLRYAAHGGSIRVFYSSSACMYPERNQMDPDNPNCVESSAYPADPDSEYGWEKLFSERLYLAYARNYGLDVRIARFHNIFGEEGTWDGGREKAPAALCRKVALANTVDTIEVWGDGHQTRSFLHIDECVEGILRLMQSDFVGPVNIGSDEMVSMNQFVDMVAQYAGKRITVKHIAGPEGVRGRNSDNTLIQQKLGWAPSQPLVKGVRKTYDWIVGELIRTTGKGQPTLRTEGSVVEHVDG